MKAKEYVVQSILAGLAIAIGGTIFLVAENKVIGSLFFALGLFTICTRGMHLFTGRVAYALENPLSYSLWLLVTWAGNLFGTWFMAFALSFTRQAPMLMEKATAVSNVKLNDSALSIFILSFFCNILVFLAVDGYKKNPHELGKYLGIFLGVSIFILCGFEHCVANMFYFSMAKAWNMHAFAWMLVMTAGNICGGLFIPVMMKLGVNTQK